VTRPVRLRQPDPCSEGDADDTTVKSERGDASAPIGDDADKSRIGSSKFLEDLAVMFRPIRSTLDNGW
jgi:hypothetical protein